MSLSIEWNKLVHPKGSQTMTSSCSQRWKFSEELRKLKKGSKAYKQLLDRYRQHILSCPICLEHIRDIAARSKPNPEFMEETHA